MACANCLHEDLINYEKEIKALKDKFSKQAKILEHTEYAIIKCSCKDGFAWRPIGHPDIKRYGAIEYCAVD